MPSDSDDEILQLSVLEEGGGGECAGMVGVR